MAGCLALEVGEALFEAANQVAKLCKRGLGIGEAANFYGKPDDREAKDGNQKFFHRSVGVQYSTEQCSKEV